MVLVQQPTHPSFYCDDVRHHDLVQLVLPAKISPPLFVKLGALTLPINAPVNLPHMKEARLDYMSRGAYKL